MKKGLLLILITIFALVGLMTPFGSIAQESDSSSIQTATEFDLELKTGTQSIFDQSVPVTLFIDSRIDANRFEIRWKPSAGISIKEDIDNLWTSVTEGDELTTTVNIVPEKPGNYRVTAEVQAWRPEGNYPASIELFLVFDDDLEIKPQTQEYIENQRTWVIARIAIGVIVLIILAIAGWLGYTRFKKWYDAD